MMGIGSMSMMQWDYNLTSTTTYIYFPDNKMSIQAEKSKESSLSNEKPRVISGPVKLQSSAALALTQSKNSSPGSKRELIEPKEGFKQMKVLEAKLDRVEVEKDHDEEHISTGEYLKSGVYGGLDGLINTLSIILGGIAAGADTNHILLIAIAGLIGDGLSMGLGDYLSSKSEIEYIRAEKERETWEAENKLQDELKEMEQLYIQKGYSEEDSKRLGQLISKNPTAFVNIMMLEELGLTNEQGSPVINGFVNFTCFVTFGFLPTLPYCINKAAHAKESTIMIASLVIGGFFLFFLGLLKAWFIGTNVIKSGLLTLSLGSAAIAIGYGIGRAI